MLPRRDMRRQRRSRLRKSPQTLLFVSVMRRPSRGRMPTLAAIRPWPRWSGCRRPDSNVLLLGPLGAGTSRLARRLTTILPAMTLAEAIDTARIHRIAGRTGARTALVTNPRFVPRIIPSGMSG